MIHIKCLLKTKSTGIAVDLSFIFVPWYLIARIIEGSSKEEIYVLYIFIKIPITLLTKNQDFSYAIE